MKSELSENLKAIYELLAVTFIRNTPQRRGHKKILHK